MAGDKFSATWVSYTSICDYRDCPRAYYLKHVYRDPNTKHKIKIMSPPLALGQAVHEVLESISVIPTATRFSESLVIKLNNIWSKVSGKRGGFPNPEVELQYKNRGEAMLLRVMKNPGVLAKPAVKIKESLPSYWLSEEKNIILCGKIDWLEYLPETDSVHIIDFKTSKYGEEDCNSLQLPIYCLIVHNSQKRKVTKASYWYLEQNDDLTPKDLPDLEESHKRVFDMAIQIQTARKLNIFKCPQESGCRACTPFEKVLRGEAEYVGVDEYSADIYIIPDTISEEDNSEIL